MSAFGSESHLNKISKRGKALFKNSYQGGLLSIFFSGGSDPLLHWNAKTKSGYINRFLDPELKALVVEIGGTNVSTTYITCPKNVNDILGIRLPFLVMVAKNLKKYFAFEVSVMDDAGTKRRFRVANFQSSTQIMPMCTVMPIGLADGWNQIQFNLSDFTYRAYKTQFIEVLRVQVNANILLRRIYFAERLLSEDELPDDYKLFFPLSTKSKSKRWLSTKDKEEGKENIKASSSKTKTEGVLEKADGEKRASSPSLQGFQERKSKTSMSTGLKKSRTSIRKSSDDKRESKNKVRESQGSMAERGSKGSKEKLIEEEQPQTEIDTDIVRISIEQLTMEQTPVEEGDTIVGVTLNETAVDVAAATSAMAVEDNVNIENTEAPVISEVPLPEETAREMTERDY